MIWFKIAPDQSCQANPPTHKRLQKVAKDVSCQVKPPTNLFKLPNYVDDLCIDILVSVTIITT